MTEWAPATEAESAMRDALRAGRQEEYFRILATVELLLPVPADALAGRGQLGWGTWGSGGRIHLLAFTSQAAMTACLAEHAGSARQISYRELAESWPDPEWWLAVDPGLPIEGYLPPWFVAQLATGNPSMPGRRAEPRNTEPRARVDRVESFQRARAGAAPAQPAAPPAEQPAAPVTLDAIRAPSVTPGRPKLPTRVPSAPPPSGIGALANPAPAARAFATVRASVPVPSAYAVPPPATAPPAAPVTPAAPMPAAPVTPAAPEPEATRARPAAQEPNFEPANEVEAKLLDAAGEANTDSFLSTLLLAQVLVPAPADMPPSARPGDPEFGWQTETLDDQPYLVVFTSPERLHDHIGAAHGTVSVKFAQLIRHWPDEQWSFAVNPGTPVGAKLPGAQIVALAAWADEVGLTGEPTGEINISESSTAVSGPRPDASTSASAEPVVMQKVIPPEQVAYYLERGYDRVSGFVYRASEVAHLKTPADLFAALGLGYSGSPFRKDADEVHVLRWSAHRPNLYRIPYGGQHEAGMRAMQGWVIERSPFRGNGFAPSENGDIIAEFKVDSVRLPHGAQLWRVTASGTETLVATFDADGPRWQRTEPEPEPEA